MSILPTGVNFLAFLTRLMRTCLSRRISPISTSGSSLNWDSGAYLSPFRSRGISQFWSCTSILSSSADITWKKSLVSDRFIIGWNILRIKSKSYLVWKGLFSMISWLFKDWDMLSKSSMKLATNISCEFEMLKTRFASLLSSIGKLWSLKISFKKSSRVCMLVSRGARISWLREAR